MQNEKPETINWIKVNIRKLTCLKPLPKLVAEAKCWLAMLHDPTDHASFEIVIRNWSEGK